MKTTALSDYPQPIASPAADPGVLQLRLAQPVEPDDVRDLQRVEAWATPLD